MEEKKIINKYFEKYYKKALYLIIFGLILTPSIRLSSSIPAIRFEEIILLIVFLWLLGFLIRNKRILLVYDTRVQLFLVFFILIGISISIGAFLGLQASIFDFNQFIRVIKYLVIYLITLSFLKLTKDPVNEKYRLMEYMNKLSIILIVIVFQQYFNLFNLNNFYVPYIARTQFETLTGDYATPRAVGMVGNPNELGFMLALFCIISLYILFYKKFKVTTLILFVFQFISVLFTLSRGALIALLSGIFLIIILRLPTIINRKNKVLSYLTTVAIFISILGMLYAFINQSVFFEENILWRFEKIRDIDSDNSWQTRLYHWQENIDLFKKDPLFGVGPLRRAEMKFASDNEWLLLLRSYGIIGTGYYISMLIVSLIGNYKNDFSKLLITILTMAFIFMIPAAVYHSLVLMPIMMILLAFNVKNTKLIEITK